MRQIYIVNCSQVVTSQSHPEGLYSVIPDYPKTYDSRSYDATETNPNGDEALALNAAKSEYYSRLATFYTGSPTRVMATVTLTRADGRQIMRDSIGAMLNMTPPAPEPEEGDEE